MTRKQDYIVMADGRVAGTWRTKGDIASLTPAQAKYENVIRNIADAIDANANARHRSKVMNEAASRAKAKAEKEARTTAEGTSKAAADALKATTADAERKSKAAVSAMKKAGAKFKEKNEESAKK